MYKQVLALMSVAAIFVLAAESLNGQQGAKSGEWRYHGGDLGSTRYSPLDQINKTNISRLRIAWRRPAVDASILKQRPGLNYARDFHSVPIMIDGVLYASNGIGLVEAFNPGTGQTLWVQLPFGDEPPGLAATSTRSLGYSADASGQRLYVVRGEYLIALDAANGEPIGNWGTSGRVNLKTGLGPRAAIYNNSSGPQVCGDVVMVGANMNDRPEVKTQAPGDVQAFDVHTGKPRWTFHVIPRPGEAGYETWEKDSASYTGMANLWSLITADEQSGLAFLPLTSPTNDMYGGHRLGDNLFSDSLVAVKCSTGERVWQYQLVHHDLWDYDNPAAPILAEINVNGKRIKAVVQLTKQAFAFVFDRLTGTPVWPIEERPVPKSATPGERTSPTQPFDLNKGDPATTDLDYVPGIRAYPPGPQGLPLLKPPYGRITAIDLNKGEIRWTVANGDGPRNHPLLQGLNLPPLGNPGRAAPLVTKTLLFLGEGDPVMVRAGSRLPREMPLAVAPGAGGKKFRAFDKATGRVLWETELPSGTTGVPITYRYRGKQYIVVAVGGADRAPEFIAFSLP